MLILKQSLLETPLGAMVTIADERALYLLAFQEGCTLDRDIKRLKNRTQTTIILGRNVVIESIEQELRQYFEGKLKTFKTPLAPQGTPFQKQVWAALSKIPHGTMRSYAEVAQALGKPTAFRAVAQANGANPITLVIPCHRVINTGGALGGYSAGLKRKEWLLQHEGQRPERA